MTTLTQFMQDMCESENMVQVTEVQLRKFTQLSDEYKRLVIEQQKTIEKLQNRIDCLEVRNEVDSIIETIDLFA